MKKSENSYKKSGVNISLANKLVNHISKISKKNVKKKSSFPRKDVIGGFGSLFDISNLKIKDPVIVSCTDGVGTKIELANNFRKFDTIGIDLVAMCINDLIVQGAKPLFFLDYIAVGKLNLTKTKKILKGIFRGCEIANCKLIGGETAEMPGVYSKNKFDLAGFSVGIVSKKKILERNKIPKNLKKEILKPTKIYSREVLKLNDKSLINAAAHITGGGLIENLLRSIPKNLSININLSKIKLIKIFKWLKSKNISDQEMLKTFNCGVGFCLVAPKKNISKIKKIFPKNYMPYEIGYVSKNNKKVNLYKSLKW